MILHHVITIIIAIGQCTGDEDRLMLRGLASVPPAPSCPADSDEHDFQDDIDSQQRECERIVIQLGSQAPIEFVLIKPGSFGMGGHYAPQGTLRALIHHALAMEIDQGPKRTVTIKKDYYLARTETRVDLYCAFLNDVDKPERYILATKWSRITMDGDTYVPKPECGNLAVNTVPWIGAVAFCDWLSSRTGRRCRLPTEAQWEYAAFGPNRRRYPWGNEYKVLEAEDPLTELRNYIGHAGRPHPWSGEPVGSCPKNVTPEGIFDMAAGVAEWVSDWYSGSYNVEDVVDPQGPSSGNAKVLRGRHLRKRERTHLDPRNAASCGFLGFRILMEAPDDQAPPSTDATDD